MKVRDIIKMLRGDGWELKNQQGSHRQFIHSTKPGKVTIAGHESDEMPPKTMRPIMKQAGMQ